MGSFVTEKEIERLLEPETRYLPIPERVTTPHGKLITTFKKKPVTMLKNVWETFDFLIDERFKIYTQTKLLIIAARTAIETKSAFDTSLHNVVASRFQSYKKTNLPILQQIDELARELEELEKDGDYAED